jgi:hypothetical protein
MQEGEKLDGAGKGRLLKTRRCNYLRASIPLAIARISENAHILFFSEIRITTGSKTYRGDPRIMSRRHPRPSFKMPLHVWLRRSCVLPMRTQPSVQFASHCSLRRLRSRLCWTAEPENVWIETAPSGTVLVGRTCCATRGMERAHDLPAGGPNRWF